MLTVTSRSMEAKCARGQSVVKYAKVVPNKFLATWDRQRKPREEQRRLASHTAVRARGLTQQLFRELMMIVCVCAAIGKGPGVSLNVTAQQ